VQHPALSFGPLAPELILVGAGMALLVAEAVTKRLTQTALAVASIVAILAAAIDDLTLWNWDGSPTVLGGMVSADRYAVLARLILLSVAVVGILFGYYYFHRVGEGRGEFYPMVLLCTSGMTLIAAAGNLIVVFLALEILSLSLYVLTGMSFRLASIEGAMKYFLLGAFSSAFFLYGIAMAYGAAGTTSIAGIADALSRSGSSQALALTAAGLLAVGFGFKVAAVPFHMWTPDVYQGASTPITAYMAAATKVAAFAALIRVFDVSFGPLVHDWTPFIWVLSALTMVVGSVLAIAQTDVKRMLAYSSIAHAGFILTAVTAATSGGVSAALFYLVAYAAMILGAFGVVMLVSIQGEDRTSLTSYAGLARRSPGLAALLTLFLLSLAGLPPTAGFIAKVSVFGAAVRAGHWSLVLIAVLASVVAAFFYLRIVVLMYMQDAQETAEPRAAPIPLLAMAAPAILTLVLGVFPGLVFGFLDSAARFR
jgi:NADH-quinone oxidoreductase subunit N